MKQQSIWVIRDKDKLRLKWIGSLLIITLMVYLSFRFLLGLVLPFIFAYFLSWIIRPVTEGLYRKFKIPRLLGGTILLLLLYLVFGIAFCMLINILIKQAIGIIRNMPVYLNMIAGKLDAICNYCDGLLGFDCGTARGFIDEHISQFLNNIKGRLMPEITQHSVTILIWFIGFVSILLIVFIAAVLITKELPVFKEKYGGHTVYHEFHKITKSLSEAGMAYFRAQLIIMLMVAVICVVALVLIKNEYALLLGMGIAILDALPLIGIGLVLIPWIIISLIQGNFFVAAILFTAFLFCQIIREVLEPKLVGNRIGIRPLYTLMAMYAGIKLFGIAGFILGPIGLVIIITIYKSICDKQSEPEDCSADFLEE